MVVEIDQLAFQLLIELRRTPLATLNDLADRLDVSPNTIKSRKTRLKELNVIKADDSKDDEILGKREISEVVAHHSPNRLGLKRIHIIFEHVENLEKLNHVLESHPFTYYQTTGMGHNKMVYAIMDIPNSTYSYLVELLDRMKLTSPKVFQSYFLLDPMYETKSNDDLQIWQKYPNWNISVDQPLFNGLSIQDLYVDYKKNEEDLDPLVDPGDTPDLDSLDLKLLRELTINCKVSASYLETIYDRDRTTISRRLSRLRDQYISYYSLLYSRKTFNLDSTFVIYGHLDIGDMRAFYRLVKHGHIPFKSNFYMNVQGNFIWHIYAHPSFINEVIYNLMDPNPEIHLILTNQSDAVRYYFYPKNYDTSLGGWKTDRYYFFLNFDIDT